MRTETTESATSRIDVSDLSQTTVFELLADERRRYALHHLSRAVGAVELADLAEQIALREGDTSPDRRDRVLAGLYHRHLPKLTDAGVVAYDPERETVELRDAADRLAPHLELSAVDDLRT